jgi:uncharacterized membrane protein
MLENFLSCYLLIALVVLCFWLWLFWQDHTTPKTHLTSWLVILIAPWFWPIVIPLSLIELNNKLVKLKKLDQRQHNLDRITLNNTEIKSLRN